MLTTTTITVNQPKENFDVERKSIESTAPEDSEWVERGVATLGLITSVAESDSAKDPAI